MEKLQVAYTSPGWVRRYLAQLRRVPTMTLDVKSAALAGAKGKNGSQFIKALAQLGIVDAEGRATHNLGRRLALRGEEYQKAVKELLTAMYPTFVRWLEEGEPITREALDTEVSRVSDLGQSARKQVIGLFRFWVLESGDDKWIGAIGASRGRAESPRVTRTPVRTRRTARPRAADGSLVANPADQSQWEFEVVVDDMMPFYRAVISVSRASELTADDWEHIRQNVNSKIDYLKSLAGRKANGDE